MLIFEDYTPHGAKINFRFFIIEPCYHFKVNETLYLLEGLFGIDVFRSSTLILRDCDHEYMPNN